MSYPDLGKLLDAKLFKKHMKASKKQGMIFIEGQPTLDSGFTQYDATVRAFKVKITREVGNFLESRMTPDLVSMIKAEVLAAKAERARNREEKEQEDGGPDTADEDPDYAPPIGSDSPGRDNKEAGAATGNNEGSDGETDGDAENPGDEGKDRSKATAMDDDDYEVEQATLPKFHHSLEAAVKNGLVVVPGHKNVKFTLRDNYIELIIE